MARKALAFGASKVIFVVDTCFSGGLDLGFDSRVSALCSSGPNEYSWNTTALLNEVDHLPFRRIAVVLDMCYGGQGIDTIHPLLNLSNSSSPDEMLYRSVTASSFFEAADGEPGKGSPFATKLNSLLNKPTKSLTLTNIFAQISEAEEDESKKPTQGYYRHGGLEFYFVKKP